MKLDIEAAEVIVLPDLMKHGILCKPFIHSMFADIHYDLNMGDIKKQIKSQSCDSTEYMELDDEAYFHDVDNITDINEEPVKPYPLNLTIFNDRYYHF